jgi:actin-related protein 3
MTDSYKTVVIDNGTGYTKMGFAGILDPIYIMPTAISDLVEKNEITASKMQYDQLDFFIGNECFQHFNDRYAMKYPIRSGMIEDWELMEKYWHRSIYNYLRVEPNEHYFILTEPPLNTPENREQMAEIMFETFNVEGLYIGVQAVLALYAGMVESVTKGDLTGTVLDSGDGVTHIIPVADGFVIGSCIKHIPIAGRDITRFMLNMINARENVSMQDLVFITQEIKEKYGYVCQNAIDELKLYDTKQNINGLLSQSAKFKKFNGIGPISKNPFSIDVGYEAFMGPEMFFHPVITISRGVCK